MFTLMLTQSRCLGGSGSYCISYYDYCSLSDRNLEIFTGEI